MTNAVAARHVEEATERFVDVLTGLDVTTWTAIPPGGRWSMSEVLEHVTITNSLVMGLLERGLEPIGDDVPDVTDDDMPYLFYDGEEPPHIATPTGTWSDRDQAVTALWASADALADWARTTDVDLRRHGLAHPVFGLFDGFQWVRFAAVHTLRHRAELQATRRALAG